MNDSGKGTVDIDIREDGLYLVIENPEVGQRVSRKDVLDIIERFGVQDIDFAVINDIFKSSNLTIERKISSNTKIIQKDEQMFVELTKDRMLAFIKFTAAANKGQQLTSEEIRQKMDEGNIKYGIDINLLEELYDNRDSDYPYLIAKGLAPVNGTDGYLEYHFDTSAASRKPKIEEDGSVDFHQLSIIKGCFAQDILITSIPPIDGRNGMDVTGKMLPFKKGKLAPIFPRGKNVRISEDGRLLIAEVNGHIIYANNRLDVSPVLDIKGDIDNSTGNIEFNGTVYIRGNVLTGFSVKAYGNIEVMGVVEGAVLDSKSHIVMIKGAQGSDKAEITAAGDITAKFIESCKVSAGGDITSDSVLHSDVRCGGKMMLTGKRGSLVGGKAIVRNQVNAKVIGSNMAVTTTIEIGHTPEELEVYRQMASQINNFKTEYDKINKVVDTLILLNTKSPLPDDKKALLLKSVHTKLFLKNKLAELQKKLDANTLLMASHKGKVVVHDVIHGGVNVLIGDALLHVRDDMRHITMVNDNGRINVIPGIHA